MMAQKRENEEEVERSLTDNKLESSQMFTKSSSGIRGLSISNSDLLIVEEKEGDEEGSGNCTPTQLGSSLMSPESPSGMSGQSIPSPIITRRTRTDSTSARAFERPLQQGKVKAFCRTKGHGFITPDSGEEDLFVHISDIEGEYIPLPGDEVTYRLCPVPPKLEKCQAVHVIITHLTPEVHHRWDCPTNTDKPHRHPQ